jgi:hypothetical protein
MVALQRAAGNRAVSAALAAVQVQRDRIAASGFTQPLTEQEEFAAAHRKDGAGRPVKTCWEPQSIDFRAAANGPTVGSFDEFISTMKGRGTAKQDVMLIGHGSGRQGGFFGFGGPVNKANGCDEVHLTLATGISVDSVAAKQKDLALAGKALTSLTLAACNAGVDPAMVQKLANALGVCVNSFSDPVTFCLGGTPGNFVRGKVLSGSEVPELATCNDAATLVPDRPRVCPQKPEGAKVRDLAFDENDSSLTLLNDGAITARPAQFTDLTPASRAKARAFYASQPDRYTPALITRMQQALGRPSPSGRIDDATVDAVVAFQDEHPPLKGDGMAGPRTLSRLLPFGLATEADRTHYSTSIDDAVDTSFVPGSSIEQRLAAAWGAVIPALTAEQVTPIPAVAKGPPSAEGGFRISEWTVFISPLLLDPLPLPQDKRMQLRSHVYHEARHAEQLFNVARMLAAKRFTPAEITVLVGTTRKPEVATEAKSRPLTRGSTEFVVAEQLFEATHGEAGRRHKAVEQEAMAKRKARDAALAAAGGDRTDPRVVKAQQEYDKAHAAYIELADEADAFATGDQAAQTPRDLGDL